MRILGHSLAVLASLTMPTAALAQRFAEPISEHVWYGMTQTFLGRPNQSVASLTMCADGSVLVGTIEQSAGFAVITGHNTSDVGLLFVPGTDPTGGALGGAVVRDQVQREVFSLGEYTLTTRYLDTGYVALLSKTPNGTILVARHGDPVPPLAGVTFSQNLGVVGYTPRFEPVFLASLSGPAGPSHGLFVGSGAGMRVIAQRGMSVNAGAQVIDGVGRVLTRRDGSLIFECSLSTTLGTSPATPQTSGSIFEYDAGVLRMVARAGQSLANGATLDRVNLSALWARRQHRDASDGALAVDVQVNGQQGVGILDRQGQFERIVLEGTLQPSLPFDVASFDARNAWVTDGSLLVAAELAVGVGGVTSGDDSTILSIDRVTGAVRVLVREADQAPGAPTGRRMRIGSLVPAPIAFECNPRGQVLFRLEVFGAPQLFAFEPGPGLSRLTPYPWEPRLPAHGLVEPQVYSINEAGQVAAFVKDHGVTPGANQFSDAIWRTQLGEFQAVPAAISATTGGTQTMFLNAGPRNANALYLIAGTLSGIRPGLRIAGVRLPLNWDGYSSASLGSATVPYTANVGVLDAAGAATAQFSIPPLGFSEFYVHHAFVTLSPNGGITGVSQPIGVWVY